MNRELDGCYFRIVRDGVGQSVCFTDLTKAERDALLADMVGAGTLNPHERR